jgi:thermitase
VAAAWQFASSKPTTAIRVAVLDDGVDVTHPDLESIVGEQFDSFAGEQPCPLPHDRHGTGCAGLAAATPAADGMKGVASGATLLPVRVNFTSTPGGDLVTSSSRIRRGIEWAVAHNADVLCLSWSTEPSLSVRLALETAAKSGRKGKGCVVVCAAGNDGGRVAFPALLDSVIAVAGTDANQALKRGSDWSSNFGPEVDVAAPGTQTFTTSMQGGYQCVGGTSGAAAMVGGAAALCLRLNSALTAKEVRDLLIATSDLLPAGPAAPNGKLKFVDVEAAVKAAAH